MRAYLKRYLPRSAKSVIFGARKLMANPPIDDIVLARYRFIADGSEGVRLNLVIPNLTEGAAFGGVLTGLDLYLRAAAILSGRIPLDLRVVVTNADTDTTPALVASAMTRHGFDPATLDFVSLPPRDAALPVRRNDLFFTYNWWTTLNTSRLVDTQAEHFGVAQRPVLYLIQEYEPHLFPFSSAQMLAREAYDGPARLWGLFNSSNLLSYFRLMGHRVEREFMFEPAINDRLRPYLSRVEDSRRERRILVYGRPAISRNCFPALMRGLRRWAECYPDLRDWEIVSAGTMHKPIPLPDGRAVRSLGKLSFEEYGDLLLSSSVGVSLMASPHPSYPPLEMAHMGLQVVTNSYLEKDLSAFHPNILSIASIDADALAQGLHDACRRAETGARKAVVNPDYVREDPFAFLADLIDQLERELG